MENKKELVSQFQIEISPLIEEDVENLDSILMQHVRDRNTGEILENEIQEIKTYMRGGKDDYGRIRKYLVAKARGGSKVFGCMGYSVPDSDMIKHFADIPPGETIELLNAFVDSEVFRGGGIGQKLFEALCDTARAEGKKYLTLNSGPRFRASWGFYDRLCDENRGFIVGKFGPGGDANTWLKKL